MSSQQTEQIYEDPRKIIFIQSRATTDYSIVDEYATMMRDGVQFDAAQAIIDEGGQICVFDGLHRGEAAKQVGGLLLIEVRSGTQAEAEWLALSMNQKHGLRRTRADKQRVVRNALLHPRGANLSDRKIARHCGVDHKTVGRIRQELVTSGEIPQIEKRTVMRGGQVYEQNTGKIGRPQSTFHETNIKKKENAPKNPTTCTNCGAPEPGGAWYHNGDTWLCANCSPPANKQDNSNCTTCEYPQKED